MLHDGARRTTMVIGRLFSGLLFTYQKTSVRIAFEIEAIC